MSSSSLQIVLSFSAAFLEYFMREWAEKTYDQQQRWWEHCRRTICCTNRPLTLHSNCENKHFQLRRLDLSKHRPIELKVRSRHPSLRNAAPDIKTLLSRTHRLFLSHSSNRVNRSLVSIPSAKTGKKWRRNELSLSQMMQFINKQRFQRRCEHFVGKISQTCDKLTFFKFSSIICTQKLSYR